MKRKNIYFAALMGLVLSLNSCNDFLDIAPLNDIILENFWNEKNDVDNMVTSCYSSLQSQSVISSMMAWGEFRSDHIIGGTNVANNEDLTNIFKENINAKNTFTNWADFYYVINICNTVLYYAPSVAKKDPSYTASELAATRAEVTTLRALCYFYLIRAFRDVPYVTVPFIDDTQKMDLPATPFYDVLDSLIVDLEKVKKFAVKTYPSNKTYYQTGRVTLDAIHALLCELYLWKEDYSSSVRYADLVIQAQTDRYQKQLDKWSGTISQEEQMIKGYPLVSDKMSNYYGNAFNTVFGIGNSRESIFELTFMSDETMLSNGSISFYYGNATTFPGSVKPAEFISNDLTLETPAFFVDKYDVRYYENIQQVVGTNDYGINKYTTRSCIVNPSGTTPMVSYSSFHSSNYCHANWIIYRLSDVMLMKAEAMVQMIPENDSIEGSAVIRDSLLKEAFDIVDVISMRSNYGANESAISFDSYSSKSQMTNLILEERARELMFEGKRWFDLLRRSLRDGNTNYLISQVTRKGMDNASVVQSKLSRMEALFWPYNKEELQVNGNLVQNPAYNTEENGSYESTK